MKENVMKDNAMNNNSILQKDSSLWVTSCKIISSLTLFVLLFSCTFLVFNSFYTFGKAVDLEAVDGNISVDMSYYNDYCIGLLGEWDYVEGQFLTPQQFNEIPKEQLGKIVLPIKTIGKAGGPSTYRLLIKTSEVKQKQLGMYIQHEFEDLAVYVNGNLVAENKNGIQNNFNLSNYIADFSLNDNSDINEIIIAANSSKNQTLFYHKNILIGSVRNIIEYAVWEWAKTFFQVGLLIALLINGLVFTILRPEHKLITRMNIFDSLMIARLIFGLPELYMLLSSEFPGFSILDGLTTRLQLSTLMLAGSAGMALSDTIFNGGVRTKISKVVSYAYIGFSVIVFLPFAIDKLTLFAILPLYILTTSLMLISMLNCLKTNKTRYIIMQIFKTAYIGIIIMFDLLKMAGIVSSEWQFTQYYILFFLVHVIVRLMDNNNSYKTVETLNNNLEKMVVQRTSQLLEANKKLSEISVRDALTGAFNRLHFERVIEQAVVEFYEKPYNLFMCILDLDSFKKINDTYGHAVGDEVLITLAKILHTSLPPEVTLARIGGEEFILLIKNVLPKEAYDMIEDARKAVEENKKKNEKHTTASFGFTQFKEGMTSKDLFKAADACLYKAKNTGKNKIVSDIAI